jgi:hypothetical protein
MLDLLDVPHDEMEGHGHAQNQGRESQERQAGIFFDIDNDHLAGTTAIMATSSTIWTWTTPLTR